MANLLAPKGRLNKLLFGLIECDRFTIPQTMVAAVLGDFQLWGDRVRGREQDVGCD
jgi:hypothetical protein